MKKNYLRFVSVIVVLVLTLVAPFSVLPAYAEIDIDIMYGDVNQDSKINAKDAYLVLLYSARLIYSPQQEAMLDVADFTVADVSGDGKINAVDALHIARYAAKIIDEFAIFANIQEALSVDTMRNNMLGNIEKCVTLGDYKSIEVDSEVLTVTDARVQEYIDLFKEYIGVSELTDEIVESMGFDEGISTVEEFEVYVWQLLEEEIALSREQLILDEVNRQLLASSTIHSYSLPDLDLETLYEEQIIATKEAAASTPYNYREYIYANTGLSIEEYENTIYEGLSNYVDLCMIYRAIINAENIAISQEDFEAENEAQLDDYEKFGYEAVEEFGKELYQNMLYSKVEAMLCESAVIIDK